MKQGALLVFLGTALIMAGVAASCAGESFSPSTSSSSGAGGGTGGNGGGAGGNGGATVSSSSASGSGGASSSSTGGTGGSGGGPVCMGLGDACSDCTFGACPTEYCACYADTSCATLVSCFNACGPGDMACQQTCMNANPDYISQAFLLGDCAATTCMTECPGVVDLDACPTCLFTSCSQSMNACFANAECQAIALCVINTCTPITQACALGCAAQHPNGQILAFTALQCLNANCSAQCN